VIAAGVASDNHGVAMAGAALAAKLALELPNSRVAEAEADRIGIELARPAPATTRRRRSPVAEDGQPATAIVRPPEFLSTHPAPENRQARKSAA
jgi:predicted Zn-dependent protease